jgi:hypothetical protein
MRDYTLRGRERLPLRESLLLNPPVCSTLTAATIGWPSRNTARKVALYECGKRFQLPSVEGLGLDRKSGRFEAGAQFFHPRFPTELPVDDDRRRDGAHGIYDGQRYQHTPGAALT